MDERQASAGLCRESGRFTTYTSQCAELNVRINISVRLQILLSFPLE